MASYAYLWNEHEGRKRSCEVATCVMNFWREWKIQGAKSEKNVSDYVVKLRCKIGLGKFDLIYLC